MQGQEESRVEITGVNAVGTVLALIATGGVGWYLKACRREDPATARRLVVATRRRIERRHAVSPQDNGYLALAPFFDERPESAPARSAITELANWFDGTRDASQKKMRNDAALIASHIAAFDTEVLPALSNALAHAVLVLPQAEVFQPTPLPLMLNSRSLVLALCVRGWSLEEQERWSDALSGYITGLILGGRYARQGPLVGTFLGMAMQGLALQALADLVSRDALARPSLDEAMKALLAENSDDADFVDRVDEEYLDSVDRDVWLQSGKSIPGTPPQRAFERLLTRILGPPVSRIQRSMSENDYLAIRSLILAGNLGAVQHGPELSGSLLSMLLDGIRNGVAQWLKIRTTIAAVLTVSAIQAYRCDHGRLPSSLDDLVPEYLDCLTQDFMAPPRGFLYRVEGGDFVLESSSPKWRHARMRERVQFHPYIPLHEQAQRPADSA